MSQNDSDSSDKVEVSSGENISEENNNNNIQNNQNKDNIINSNIGYMEINNENRELTHSEINRLNKIREDTLNRSLKYKQTPEETENEINIDNSAKIGKEPINPNNERKFNKVQPFLFFDNEPFAVIGPHLTYYILIFTFVSFLSIIIFSLKKKVNSFLKFLFFVSYLLFSVSYTLLMIKNPGIPKDKSSLDLDDLERHYKQCNQCECIVYKDKYRGSRHCADCDICVEDFEGHYQIATKCVGRGNKIIYRIWIVSIPIFAIVSFLYLIL